MEMTAILRGQVLKCRWRELPALPSSSNHSESSLPAIGPAGGGGTLRVTLERPPRPAIIDIQQGDALYMLETRQTWRVALFVPDMYRLARGGLVHLEGGI